MTRGYWKTASGHPVQAAAVVRRHASDFVFGGHLGVILAIHDGAGAGLLGAGASAAPRNVDGYLAQVLIVDDGRRAPYQVLDGVVVCSGAPLGAASATRVRPNPTSQRVLPPEQRTELLQSGRLPQDLPIDALDGDWCVVQYLGGNEQRPYVSAFWPAPLRVASAAIPPAPRDDLGTVLEARHAGLSLRIDARGSLSLSTEEAGAHAGESALADEADAAGPAAPSVGGDVHVAIKPGRRIRITSGGRPLLTIGHDGLSTVLELGDPGDRPWEDAVLGGALVAFWNQFRTDLTAKLQAIEAQFERFYTQEYALHQHGLGPNGTTPPAQPPPNPTTAVFQPAAGAQPAAPAPGQAPADPPRTPAGNRTDDGTFATMKTYRLLSPALRLPHPDARPAPRPDEEG